MNSFSLSDILTGFARGSAAFLFLYLVGCSQKANLATLPSAAAQATATNTLAPNKFYFSELQILTETSPEGTCSDENRLQENFHEDWTVKLDERDELEFVDKADFKFFGVNVTLETIGFDTGKYSFTGLDGRVPKAVPFQMKLRRTPGQILEFTYLGKVVEMKLLTTPVYTFSVVEKRGDCTINHNVNVFTERVGYFKKKARL